MRKFLLLGALLLAACEGSSDAPAAVDSAVVAVDTSMVFDVSPPDAGEDTVASDTSVVEVEAAPPPFDIIGTASGECGAVTAAVRSTSSVVVEVPISFDAMDKWERARLSPGGQRIFDAPNAGGSSKESEVMTYEILFHCDSAVLLKTETEIKYDPAPDGSPATISDMIITIGGEKLGVNPKRVFKPEPLTMTDTEVRDQLIKNFQSLTASSLRVSAEDKWSKQILHLWVPNATYYDAVKRVLPTIDATTKGNTLVLITRSTGGGFLYCDPDPPLGTECPPIK